MSVKPLFKQNQIVVVLAGRYAGCKGYISYANEKKICVAVLKNTLKPITKEMKPEQIEKKTQVKVALKEYSPKHLIPTRFSVKENEFVQIKKEVFQQDQAEYKKKVIQEVEKKLTESYRKGSDSFIFKELKF